MTQTPFGETFRFNVWGDEASTGLGFTLVDPGAPRLDLEVAAVARPQVLAFVPEAPNGGAMLVMAGGGYTQLMVGKEGVEVALWLNGLGYHAFVLVHRFPDAAEGPQAPVDDAIEAMRLIRRRAPGLGVDVDRVGALGLSSGGHLAACLVAAYPTAWTPPTSAAPDQSARPNALIVGYGPISTNAERRAVVADKPPLSPVEKQALYDTLQPDAQLVADPPAAFIVYAASDPIVPVENGFRLQRAYLDRGAHAELHVFAQAPHGFALRSPDLPVGAWPGLCARWLEAVGV
ncbi:alpha/beta hydrolase [Caulobacter sp.]|uniref:alpha/beta hydrolase n=1 Tax=Caulobacter sp. TaxID=78 RepID=UPI003BB0A7BC